MIDKKELQQLIQNNIYNGFDERTVYDCICSKLQAIREIKWPWEPYDNLNNVNQTHIPSNNQLKKVLQLIREELKRASNTLISRRCPTNRCKLSFLSPHYAIDVDDENIKYPAFYLCDLFLGRTKQLRFNDRLTLSQHYFDIVALNADQFIGIKASDLYSRYSKSVRRDLRKLCLMEVDKNSLECKLLDSSEFPYNILSIAKDMFCCDRFCLLSEYSGMDIEYFVQICYLEDSKIKDETDTLKIDLDQFGYMIKPYPKSFQLNGNEMSGLVLIDTANNHHLLFMIKIQINKHQTLVEKCFEIKIRGEEYSSFPYINAQDFVWYGQKLIVTSQMGSPTAYLFAEIDMNTQMMTHFYPNILIDHSFYSICDFYLGDGVLLVCAVTERSANQHVNYRVPLSRPDKLKTIATMQLYKQSMLMEQRDYLLKQLPATLFN